MVEGQEGVSWPQWFALAHACEEHGLETMFRSDHYLSNAHPHEREALDAWTTIAGLAAATTRLRLGTLVSPVTFRHPALLAKAVATADNISGGRVELGMGTGWMDDEHTAYGFPFPPMPERVERLAEQTEIVHGLLTEERTSFEGRHYRLEDAPGLPRPVQQPRPRLLIGGSAKSGTVAPAVRFADEYNTLLADRDECAGRRRVLDEACERGGRDPKTLAMSLMLGFVLGRDEDELRERAARIGERFGGRSADEVLARNRERGTAGTPEQLAATLRELEEVGVERVMLQHLIHDDLETVELIGRELVPAVA